jgi:hypothetical protein
MARTTFSRNEIKGKPGESWGEEKTEPKDAAVDRRAKAPSPLARPSADGPRVGMNPMKLGKLDNHEQEPWK